MTSAEHVSRCRLRPYKGTVGPKNPSFCTNKLEAAVLTLLPNSREEEQMAPSLHTPWSWCSTDCPESLPDAALSPKGGPGTHTCINDLILAAAGNEEMPDVTPFVNF